MLVTITFPTRLARNMFVIWLALLIPWAAIAPLSGMAFDAGNCWRVYLYVWSMLTYPIGLILAWTLRRVAPLMIWLPVINVIGVLAGGSSGAC